MQGDFTANKFTTHGIRAPNLWGGEITILHLGISYSNYNQFDDQSKGFYTPCIHVFTQGRGIKPQFVWVVLIV